MTTGLNLKGRCMTLEEEKKLVADWMGWIHVSVSPGDNFFYTSGNIIKDRILVKEWNPQSERKWWDEIWEKIDDKNLSYIYVDKIVELEYVTEISGLPKWWHIHTAKPEICWKALIKAINND